MTGQMSASRSPDIVLAECCKAKAVRPPKQNPAAEPEKLKAGAQGGGFLPLSARLSWIIRNQYRRRRPRKAGEAHWNQLARLAS
jgi:hypothetical protein